MVRDISVNSWLCQFILRDEPSLTHSCGAVFTVAVQLTIELEF